MLLGPSDAPPPILGGGGLQGVGGGTEGGVRGGGQSARRVTGEERPSAPRPRIRPGISSTGTIRNTDSQVEQGGGYDVQGSAQNGCRTSGGPPTYGQAISSAPYPSQAPLPAHGVTETPAERPAVRPCSSRDSNQVLLVQALAGGCFNSRKKKLVCPGVSKICTAPTDGT